MILAYSGDRPTFIREFKEALYIWGLSATMFELFHYTNFAGGAGLPTGPGPGIVFFLGQYLHAKVSTGRHQEAESPIHEIL
jgi:hypothetical protein